MCVSVAALLTQVSPRLAADNTSGRVTALYPDWQWRFMVRSICEHEACAGRTSSLTLALRLALPAQGPSGVRIAGWSVPPAPPLLTLLSPLHRRFALDRPSWQRPGAQHGALVEVLRQRAAADWLNPLRGREEAPDQGGQEGSHCLTSVTPERCSQIQTMSTHAGDHWGAGEGTNCVHSETWLGPVCRHERL